MRAVIDTSVVIDFERLDRDELPAEVAIAAVTLAELAAGPHTATTIAERAVRQDRLSILRPQSHTGWSTQPCSQMAENRAAVAQSTS